VKKSSKKIKKRSKKNILFLKSTKKLPYINVVVSSHFVVAINHFQVVDPEEN